MTAPKFHSLNSLLTSDASQLKLLTAEARQLIQLRDAVRGQLSPQLASHCLGACLEAGILVIYMDSAAAATPIRYQRHELMDKLSTAGLRCQALKIQILPDPPVTPAPKAAAHKLSDTVCRILESTAAQLSEGPLKHSLQRLARNRDPRF
jgi:hypothetical protein